MRSIITTVLLLLSVISQLPAQISMVLEGYGARRVHEYYIGDVLVYKLEDDKHWNRVTIQGYDAETGLILAEHGVIRIDDITRLKRLGGKKTPRFLAKTFGLFGAQWLVYSGLYSAASEYSFQKRDWQIPAASGILSGIMHIISGDRRYRVGKSKRLRIRDLRWQEPLS